MLLLLPHKNVSENAGGVTGGYQSLTYLENLLSPAAHSMTGNAFINDAMWSIIRQWELPVQYMWHSVHGVRKQVVVVKRTTAWVLRWPAKGASEARADRDGKDPGDATVQTEGHAG